MDVSDRTKVPYVRIYLYIYIWSKKHTKNRVVQSFSFVNFVHRIKFDYVTHRIGDKDLSMFSFYFLPFCSILAHVCVCVCRCLYRVIHLKCLRTKRTISLQTANMFLNKSICQTSLHKFKTIDRKVFMFIFGRFFGWKLFLLRGQGEGIGRYLVVNEWAPPEHLNKINCLKHGNSGWSESPSCRLSSIYE